MDRNLLYIGRVFDPNKGKTVDKPVFYDPDDLTTHAVVVGMTGSGKTGLCIVLLEEAALSNIPALMIDPKADITNALLHFPGLSPKDFQPWINLDQARREGKTPEEAASEAASMWRKGLADWGISSERIAALQNAVKFAIYTPGSEAGIPINILGSLKASEIPWDENRELHRERISGTVTALLALVGFQDVDPVTSREHILLSNIFEQAWSHGRDLSLAELIMQIQTPSFSKLGVFDVNTFFPAKERLSLAMRLNNILASPSFQAWREGEPLDIQHLLYDSTGKPRHSVFYIAHLSDAERMFFVTLLFTSFETWMRSQAGTSTLRALIYFDEIYGYLPPVANPPSKQPMLRMLKQARAFGIGLILATQNPVDVDYKGLSNAGTWFIGKLQTDQDKQRLLDGLEGAAAGFDRRTYDALISSLGKRVFLLHNVHRKEPIIFQTRWAMNYLTGPLTRVQIPALNRLVGASMKEEKAESVQSVISATPPKALELTQELDYATRPSIPIGIREYFLRSNLTISQAAKAAGRVLPSDIHVAKLLYRPVLLAQAKIRYLDREYNLDYVQTRTVLVANPDRRGMISWDNFNFNTIEQQILDQSPVPQARFTSIDTPLSDAKTMKNLEKDFLEWVYRSSHLSLLINQTLKICSSPQLSAEEFNRSCSEAAYRAGEAEVAKIAANFDSKIAFLREKLRKEELELEMDKAEYENLKKEELVRGAETILGILSKRRRSISPTMTKYRQAQKAKADIDESIKSIEAIKNQIAELERSKVQAISEVKDRWNKIVSEVTEIKINPSKKDVHLDLFGVAWFPYYVVQFGEETLELPAFGSIA
ncbi:MAG: helicase HerA domain-containing protein [Thermoproteota archaeon]